MSRIVRGLRVLIRAASARVSKKQIILKTLGERIREARKKKGFTQEDLAHGSNIDRSYIGGVERGERNLSFDKLCQIAHALHTDVAALTKDLPGWPR
ncbi:MAG: transcriptional regulator [Pedosphaera sp.]|nr:transcriptional regulator [Pedosphaera sp.]